MSRRDRDRDREDSEWGKDDRRKIMGKAWITEMTDDVIRDAARVNRGEFLP